MKKYKYNSMKEYKYNYYISNICSAFDDKTIGSKVSMIVDKNYDFVFFKQLESAIKKYDFSKDRVKGQSLIIMPKSSNKLVSPGTTIRSNNPDDFVIRKYRGQVGMFMKRKDGQTSKKVAVVLYTKDAYMKDPDFDAKAEPIVDEHYDYVIVAVLGFPTNEQSTVSYSRFVKNLAGANNEYKVMSKKDLVELAIKVSSYHDKYYTVAD